MSALPAAAQSLPAERNTRHGLIVGVGEYLDPDVPTLKSIPHDRVSARRMAAAMAAPEASTRRLRDHDATAERMRNEITSLQARRADGDRVFIFYSSHDTRWFDDKVQQDDCADTMLVFCDACFSGGVAGAPFRTRSLQGCGKPGAASWSDAFGAALLRVEAVQ